MLTNLSFEKVNWEKGYNLTRKIGRIILVIKWEKGYVFSKKIGINKIAYMENGNIKLHNLKILHWNKGNSLFNNKNDDIYFILDKYKPHIMSISEANYNNIDRTDQTIE